MFQSKSIAVLTYHSVDESGSVLSISPRLFVEQMNVLHQLGIKVLPLSEVRNLVRSGGPTEPVVVITFDDGFRSVYQDAFPVLERYGFPATVFLVTDYCGKANSWPGQPIYIERNALLEWGEIKEMSTKGITFGSHTRTHPDLTKISPRHAEEELTGSKKRIEDVTGCPVDTCAYPYGAYNTIVKQLTQNHFTGGCSTHLGFVQSGCDLFALERLDMYYLRQPVLFQRLFAPEFAAYVRFRRTARDLRRLMPGWINRVRGTKSNFESNVNRADL
jgi:peptidoglycan/xylan/chitin deacetylase (PgdA/CDA1 family)